MSVHDKLIVEEANTVPLGEVEVEAMDGVRLEEPSHMDLATTDADSPTADGAVASPVVEIEVHSAEEFLQRLIEQSRRIAFEVEVEFGRGLGWESRWNALTDAAQAVSAKHATLAVTELLDRFKEAYETAHPRDHQPGRLYSNGVLEYLLCDTCQRSYDTCDRVVCLDARGRDPASAYAAFMAQRMVQCEVERPYLHQASRKRRTEGPPPTILLFRQEVTTVDRLASFPVGVRVYHLASVIAWSQEICLIYYGISSDGGAMTK